MKKLAIYLSLIPVLAFGQLTISPSGSTSGLTFNSIGGTLSDSQLPSDVLLADPGFDAVAIFTESTGFITLGLVTDNRAALSNKPSVTVFADATTGNLTLSGVQTIDSQAGSAGVTLVVCSAQTDGTQNGPWVMQSGAWTRPTWYPNGGTVQAMQFAMTQVRLGTLYRGHFVKLTASGAITIGTTSTTWTVNPVSHNSTVDDAPTTDMAWGSHKITSLADPSSAQDAMTKNYFTDANISTTDVTTNNVASNSKHGFAPKGDGDTTKFWRADWTEAVPAGGSGGGVISYSAPSLTLTSNTYYAPPGGGGTPSTTEANVDVPAPSAATITNFQVETSAAPGAGNTFAFTWRKAGSDQSSTCTISGASATSCSDTTHSFTVAQGDLVDVKIVTTGTIVVTPNVMWLAQWGTTGSNGTVNSGTANQLGYFASTGTAISGLTTANSGLLITDGTGVPSIGTAVPSGVTATTQSAADNSTKVATTAYADSVSGGWIYTKAGSDVTITSQTIGDFSTPVVTGTLSASSLYEVEAYCVITNAGDTAGSKFAFTSASATNATFYATGESTNGAAAGPSANVFGTVESVVFNTSSSGQVFVKIFGNCTTSSGSPTISLQALKVTSGTLTLKAGSYIRVRKM